MIELPKSSKRCAKLYALEKLENPQKSRLHGSFSATGRLNSKHDPRKSYTIQTKNGYTFWHQVCLKLPDPELSPGEHVMPSVQAALAHPNEETAEVADIVDRFLVALLVPDPET